MIVLDTHVIVFDALEPGRLSRRAREAIERGSDEATLGCSDISLWEIAMLVARRRIDVGADATRFIDDALRSRAIRVLPITPRVAVLAQSDAFAHGDPADRLIAATAFDQHAALVSSGRSLRRIKSLRVIW